MVDEDSELLRSVEPNAAFQRRNVQGISQGRQSRVEVLEFPGHVKDKRQLVVWKRMGVNKGLTEAEADHMHGRLRPYRRSLRQAGWNVPKLFNTFVIEAGSEYQVVSFESFIPGGDGQYLAEDPAQPNYRKWYLLRSAIETLAEYPRESLTTQMVADRLVTRLPHGLDLKLANLVQDPEGILYFVDLFGPKEIDLDGRWVSYNSKMESIDQEGLLAVCATREGAILRMYRLAEQSWLASGSLTRDELRGNLPDVLEQSGLPQHEQDLILAEIDQEYPWLDGLYQEHHV